jgi:hypothetical protein
MRHTRVQQPTVKLNLFHPNRPEPAWQTLPEAARHKVVKLLAQLLREHQQRPLSATLQDKEVRDE